jgi:quinol monooxygenase YgiN
MQLNRKNFGMALCVLVAMVCGFRNDANAQDKNLVARMTKLRIDPYQVEFYKAALKTQIETTVKEEQGVLTLYAVAEKNSPTRITIFEVYADEQAYKAHLETAHYKKYKTVTKSMIRSSVVTPCLPIALGAKAR